jgi:PEP-CTERM motif
MRGSWKPSDSCAAVMPDMYPPTPTPQTMLSNTNIPQCLSAQSPHLIAPSCLMIIAGALPLFLLAAPAAVAAYSLTPVFPVPGGTTFSSSGTSSGQSGGRTNYYSGFDESQYDELAWSFITIPNPYHSTEAGPGGNMTYSGYNPGTGVMTWVSTSDAVWSTAFGAQNIATKLVAQFQPFTGTHNAGPLGSGWLVPTSAANEALSSVFGGDGSWPLADVDATGVQDQFQVWFQFQTLAGTPLLQYYDSTNSLGGSMNTGFTGGFLVSVPEPSTALLGGLGVLALLRRRR